MAVACGGGHFSLSSTCRHLQITRFTLRCLSLACRMAVHPAVGKGAVHRSVRGRQLLIVECELSSLFLSLSNRRRH